MRPLVSTATGVLATAALLLTPALVGTSAASPHPGPKASSAQSHGQGHGQGHAARPAAKPSATPTATPPASSSRAKAKVVVVGVVSATQTVTTGATSTVVVSVRVQGGDKEYRGRTVQVRVDGSSVVKRNNGRASRYELQVGDKVTVHARRAADAGLTATYVAASGRPASRPVPSASPATSTATTR